MSTPVFCCGFECGLYDVAITNAHWDHNNPGEIDTVVVRSGSRSLKWAPVGQSSSTRPSGVGSSTHIVTRFYVYFEDLPDVDVFIGSVSGGIDPLGLAFKVSDSKLYCAYGLPVSFGASGYSVSTGQWYRVDIKIDQTSGAKTCDAQIAAEGEDPTVLGQKTSTSATAATPFGIGGHSFSGGFGAGVTGTWYFDDLIYSQTAADYPIGEGFVYHFVPTADGTHNIAGSNDFERGNTGVDITNATTDAYLLIDDVPPPLEPAGEVDAIAAVDPANATDYVEVIFGPAPGIPTLTQGPQSVQVLISAHKVSGTVNAKFDIVDNATLDTIHNADFAATGVQYLKKHYDNPPSAASVWGITGGDGNFSNLRMRFYSSDADPDVYFDSVMIEADFPGNPDDPGEGSEGGGYYACAGTLPQFDLSIRNKISQLRALRDAGSSIGQVFQMVKIDWPSPTGAIYYAVTEVDEVATVAPPVSPIEARIPIEVEPENPEWFLALQLDATIGDEDVDLSFWDADEGFSDLLVLHGEGIKVEIMYWFPEVELLLPTWHGHLRQEDAAEIDICKVKAVQGFRSSDSQLPRRAHYKECQAIDGLLFDTQEAIDEGDCPRNSHIGGLIGTDTVTPCKRRNVQDCIDRIGHSGLFMLSHATQSVTIANNQTKGNRLYSTSQGNETNLKDPVSVVMGTRRIYNMPVLASRKDLNNNDPDRGFIFIITEACEGPVQSLSWPQVQFGGEANEADPFNFRYRLGTKGQTPIDTALTTFGYSSTALVKARSGWVNPEDIDISSVSASVLVEGLNNIRVYTDADTYTRTYTDNRAWHIMEMLTNKRWGFGYDHDRLDIPSFIEAACWCANVVRFTDDNGDTWDHIRSLSHVQLNARKVQQQIEDMCMAGRLSRPFLFNGKIHIVPLRQMTSAELAAAPVFTDEGENRNIIQDEIEKGVFKTTLKISRTSDLDLPNRIECTFDNASEDFLEKPLRPVEDIDAQLAAGRVVGDNSRKINVKKYPLAGVVIEGQGIKMETALRDLGPFDEGGLQNNLELTFKAWFLDCLDLFPTKVINVQSSRLTKYGFDYFRVKNIEPQENLHYELTVQAYNETYMDAFEDLFGSIDPIPTDPPDPDPPAPNPPTDPLAFDSVSYSGGVLTILSELSV